MNDAHDLGVALKSHFPIVQIETHEEKRVLHLLEQVSRNHSLNLSTWSAAQGLRGSSAELQLEPRLNFTEDQPAPPKTTDFSEALKQIAKHNSGGVFALMDAHPYLNEPLNLRLIREIVTDTTRPTRRLVFISPKLQLPNELGRLSARFALAMPTQEHIWKMLVEEVQMFEQQNSAMQNLDKDALKNFAQLLMGLSAEDVRRQIRDALNRDGTISRDDLDHLLRFKQTALGAESILSLEFSGAKMSEIGGLHALKRWLMVRKPAFLGDAEKMGLDRPKGLLLLGVQGSGKSLAAKATASAWGVPLLRLDFATLYNKFFGETERNLREALAAAEKLAPCVLWIDEIEKGLATDAGSGADGGVSRRVLGTLLTWLAERKSRVFIAATANDISALPPELMRKGRLDEIFFVDLPDANTRKDIFRIHLKRRQFNPDSFELDPLAGHSEGFSGAEIEQAIVAALYEIHGSGAGGTLTTRAILVELKRTRPLSVVMAEKIAALREWARERTVPAD